MDQHYLQLNFVNMLTVCIMVAIGVFLMGAVSHGVNVALGRS
jgi:hypothetical protein